MPKYTCPACKKIIIRNAAMMRATGRKSICESTGKDVVLTRLRKRRKKNKVLGL